MDILFDFVNFWVCGVVVRIPAFHAGGRGSISMKLKEKMKELSSPCTHRSFYDQK